MKIKTMLTRILNKEDRFYYNLFVKNKEWSNRHPNADELLRWKVIEEFLKKVSIGKPDLNILDVGAGRGWLANLLSQYGEVQGLEPVTSVVRHARNMFPHITFHAGAVHTFAQQGRTFSLLTCSEVIEHIPDSAKDKFVMDLVALLQPQGYLIITTPREEIRASLPAQPGQPIEDWMTEEDVHDLFTRHNFRVIDRKTISFNYLNQYLEVYQAWLFQKV